MITTRRTTDGIIDVKLGGGDMDLLFELYAATSAVSGYVFGGALADEIIDDIPMMVKKYRRNSKMLDMTQFEKLTREIRPEDGDNDFSSKQD